MENIEKIKDDFRFYLKGLKGIQGFGVSYRKNEDTCHFIVNINKEWYNVTQKSIPPNFKGISIEVKKVGRTGFFNLF